MEYKPIQLKIINEIKDYLLLYNNIIINNDLKDRLINSYNNSNYDIKYLFIIIYYIWLYKDNELLNKIKNDFKHHKYETRILKGSEMNNSISLFGIKLIF